MKQQLILNSLVLILILFNSPSSLADETQAKNDSNKESSATFQALLDIAAANWDTLIDSASSLLAGSEAVAQQGAEGSSKLSQDAIQFASEKLKENKETLLELAKKNQAGIQKFAKENQEELGKLAQQAMQASKQTLKKQALDFAEKMDKAPAENTQAQP